MKSTVEQGKAIGPRFGLVACQVWVTTLGITANDFRRYFESFPFDTRTNR